jgi:uncharacterized protein (TIGR03067 family)
MRYVGIFLTAIALATSLAAQESKDTDAAGAAALQGTWLITTFNGQPVPQEGARVTLTVTGDRYYQTVGSEVNERGTFRVDGSRTPMAVDFVITEGQDAGRTQLALIEVSGDTMRASLGLPGAGQRPADFIVRDGAFVLSARRVDP